MDSLIWLDPINRDAHFLKLIAEIINCQINTTNFSSFKVITTNRIYMELGEEVPYISFFTKYPNLELGKINLVKKIILLLDYYYSFQRLAKKVRADNSFLYSSGMSLPELESFGLKQIRNNAKSMTMLVHNLENNQSGWPLISPEKRINRLLSCFDRWIFLSEYMRNKALSLCNLDRELTYVMLHPHFHPMLEDIEPEINLISQIKLISQNRPIMVYVSRLDITHGIDRFYQTLHQLNDRGISIYGVVLGRLGEGWTLQKNKQIMKSLGIKPSQVLLKIGSYSYPELLAVLNTADFVFAPYRNISQSGAIALALGEKVPVLASNVGANSEMIKHGVNGLLFPPKNLDSLLKEIESIYSSGHTMRHIFPPLPSFNSHLDPGVAVKKMLTWIKD